MILARFVYTEGIVTTVVVSGHSGYAQAGSDIICASVSSALNQLSILLEDVYGLLVDTQIDEENAEISLTIPLENARNTNIQGAITAFKLNVFSIARDYSNYIEVMEV